MSEQWSVDTPLSEDYVEEISLNEWGKDDEYEYFQINDDQEIALCVLSAFNLGTVQPDEYDKYAAIVVRALDNLIDYQDYIVPQAEKMKLRRSLGIGVIDYAHWLAKQGLKYTDQGALTKTHELFEQISYSLIKASVNLAKERGACELYKETKWYQGILPIDNYKKDLDEVVAPEYKQDWETLRQELAEYGIRNSTLMALMPSETSSQISNATNGIEPPRGLVSIKQSKDGILPQVVPEINTLKDKYQLLWDIPDNKCIIQLTGIMQKFVCQGISTNLNYNPKRFPDNRVPIKVMLKDLMEYYKLGGKQVYYHNTNDMTSDQGVDDEACEGGACAI